MPPSRFPPPTYPPGYTPSSRTRVVGSYESHYAKRNLSINIPFIKILATGFNPMDVQRDIVKEMERAFKESPHFKRLAAYIRYLPEDHIGESQGSIPPLRCKDPTPKGIADCLAEWVGERLVSTVGDYFLTQAEEKYHIQEAMADYHALYPPYNPLPRLTPEQIDALNSRPLPKFEDMLEDIYKGMEANGYDVRNAWASRLLEATMLPSKPLPTASEPGRDAPMDAVLLSADVPPEMARMAADVVQSDQEIMLPYDYDASLHESRPWPQIDSKQEEWGESVPWDRSPAEETQDSEKGLLSSLANWIKSIGGIIVDAVASIDTAIDDFKEGFGKQLFERAASVINGLTQIVKDLPQNIPKLPYKVYKTLVNYTGYLIYCISGGRFYKNEFHLAVESSKFLLHFLDEVRGHFHRALSSTNAERLGAATGDLTADAIEIFTLFRIARRGGAKPKKPNKPFPVPEMPPSLKYSKGPSQFDPAKWRYLNGEVTSSAYNQGRSQELAKFMKKLGITKDKHRKSFERHIDYVSRNYEPIRYEVGPFRPKAIKRCYYTGPSGQTMILNITYQAIEQGKKWRFVTVVIQELKFKK